MYRVIAENLAHLLIVSPIMFVTLKDRKPETLRVMLVFFVFFVANGFLLLLPLEHKELRIVGGNWNWTGKIFSILGSVFFLLSYRKFGLQDYFLTLKQDRKSLARGVLITGVIILAKTIMTYAGGSPIEWNAETIFYQSTMPGIDEEIAYRGIMLGLLAKALKPNLKMTFFHPANVVTAMLFGLAHGVLLTESFELIFKSYAFFYTLVLGMIWGWVTMNSGSLMIALVAHNLGNVAIKLVLMR